MDQFFKELVNNLAVVGIGVVIFAFCYASNVVFGIWRDVKVNTNSFDGKKFLSGLLKYAMFCVGLSFMCIGITSIPIYCNLVGLNIDEGFIEYFKIITVAGVFITASCKYIAESFSKVKDIIGGAK